ncbi:MAG: cytochrome c biogenesis heme-transporting ATPase CcmA [Gammaproteobacteria bacterium]|nr:cytochrome c biogenesis heme-transporting ATPase CcmA [Gammaproteobacteria bacterium]
MSSQMSVSQESHQLVANSLTCERGGRILFENLEFTVQSGQAMIIQGSNGAGKTSLLRIITGLSQPSEGAVSWNDQNIINIAEEFQQQLLYIGHLSAVKTELTVRENLQLLKRFWPSDAVGSIADLAENVGLRQRLSVSCSRLSAGQLRRVSLARLFISTQKLWVLDEPLTALDVGFIETVENCLQYHLKSGGMAILTTHRGIDLADQSSFCVNL